MASPSPFPSFSLSPSLAPTVAEADMSLLALGIVLGLLGSVFINTGNNLQSKGMHDLEIEVIRKAHEEGHEPSPEDLSSDNCQSRTWQIGTMIFITGSLTNFASYPFAPASILAALEAVQFVTNVFFGYFVMHKHVTFKQFFGTGMTVIGTVVTIQFAPKEGAPTTSIADCIHLWDSGAWISYIIFAIALGVAMQICSNRVDDGWKPKSSSEQLRKQNLMGLFYAVFSALFGTMSVVFAKLLGVLVELLFLGESIFAHWFTYLTIISWLFFMIIWLNRLNSALALYDPIIIIPLLQANFIFWTSVSGGIYFQEFPKIGELLTGQRIPAGGAWAGYVIGIMLMFYGIYNICPQPESDDETPMLSDDGHRDDAESGEPSFIPTGTKNMEMPFRPGALPKPGSFVDVNATPDQGVAGTITSSNDDAKKNWKKAMSAAVAASRFQNNQKRTSMRMPGRPSTGGAPGAKMNMSKLPTKASDLTKYGILMGGIAQVNQHHNQVLKQDLLNRLEKMGTAKVMTKDQAHEFKMRMIAMKNLESRDTNGPETPVPGPAAETEERPSSISAPDEVRLSVMREVSESSSAYSMVDETPAPESTERIMVENSTVRRLSKEQKTGVGMQSGEATAADSSVPPPPPSPVPPPVAIPPVPPRQERADADGASPPAEGQTEDDV